MLRNVLFAIGFSFCASVTFADEVVTWTDANGVTHFGNAQFAPAGKGQAVDIKPANAMDAPDTSKVRGSRHNQGPSVVTLDRPLVKNPRGFRGFNARSKRGTNYRY